VRLGECGFRDRTDGGSKLERSLAIMKGEVKRDFEILQQSGGLNQSIGVPKTGRYMGVDVRVSGKRMSDSTKVAIPLPRLQRETECKSVPLEGEVFVF
jgi:hypothetical protein